MQIIVSTMSTQTLSSAAAHQRGEVAHKVDEVAQRGQEDVVGPVVEGLVTGGTGGWAIGSA